MISAISNPMSPQIVFVAERQEGWFRRIVWATTPRELDAGIRKHDDGTWCVREFQVPRSLVRQNTIPETHWQTREYWVEVDHQPRLRIIDPAEDDIWTDDLALEVA